MVPTLGAGHAHYTSDIPYLSHVRKVPNIRNLLAFIDTDKRQTLSEVTHENLPVV
jgi:hypothetical protein